MDKLALKISGTEIKMPEGFDTTRFPNAGSLGAFVSELLKLAFYLATFLAFYWMVWGAISYIMARGEKEHLAKAREKIWWAIIGLLVVFTGYMVISYLGLVFGPDQGGLPIPTK